MFPKKCPACKQKSISFDEDYIFCTNCPIYRRPLNLFLKAVVWARGKRFWAWRILVLAWFSTLLIQNIQNDSYAMSRSSNPLSFLDFGIHELGHVLFSPFGEFMHIAGGSLFQCLFPLLWLAGFMQKKWYFAASSCLCWLAINMFDVATYVADARARLLPLSIGVGVLGVDPTNSDATYDQAHDWYQLLSRTNHLNSDLAIAQGLRIAATLVFIAGLVLGCTLLVHMFVGTMKRRKNDATTQ